MAIENPHKKSMLVGMIWCVLGIAVTYISYYLASDGGSYSIFYGAVIYGVYEAGKGWMAHLRELRAGEQAGEFRKWLLIGICAVTLVGALTYLSWDMMHASPFEERKQVVEVPEYGLTLTLPAGFTKVSRSQDQATDSTYAATYLYSSDSAYGYLVEMFDYEMPDTATLTGLKDRLALEAISFTDSTIIYPEIVTLGQRQAMRYGGYSSEDGVVSVAHLMLHNGNLIVVICGEEGTAIDQLHIACAAEFARYYVGLN